MAEARRCTVTGSVEGPRRWAGRSGAAQPADLVPGEWVGSGAQQLPGGWVEEGQGGLVDADADRAAAYADVSTRTLRRYIAQGRLTGYRVGPRLVKVDLSELDQLARPIPTARGPG